MKKRQIISVKFNIAYLWQYFETVKEDPCTFCASKFKGWKKPTLEEHLKTNHTLKVLPKLPNPTNYLFKSNEPHIGEGEPEVLIKQTFIAMKRPQMEEIVLTRSKKRRLSYNKIQVDMLRRFPHIGEQIFDSLDNPSLLKCKEVSRSWHDFIDEQRFPWVRMIQKYVKESNKNYTDCPKHWCQLFMGINVKSLKCFANLMHDGISYLRRQGYTSSSHELTPLHFATQYAYEHNNEIMTPIIKGLLKVEREKAPRDKNGNTPLHIVATSGNFEIAKLLLGVLENKNPKNNDGDTPLHCAAFDGNIKIAELIIKNIDDKNPVNGFQETPLHYAASAGRLDIFTLIFENVQEKLPKDHVGDTPLHKAADDKFGLCKLYKRCNPSMKGKCNHREICKFILDNVKETNSENHKGKTPLLLAIESNHSSVIDILTPE